MNLIWHLNASEGLFKLSKAKIEYLSIIFIFHLILQSKAVRRPYICHPIRYLRRKKRWEDHTTYDNYSLITLHCFMLSFCKNGLQLLLDGIFLSPFSSKIRRTSQMS